MVPTAKSSRQLGRLSTNRSTEHTCSRKTNPSIQQICNQAEHKNMRECWVTQTEYRETIWNQRRAHTRCLQTYRPQFLDPGDRRSGKTHTNEGYPEKANHKQGLLTQRWPGNPGTDVHDNRKQLNNVSTHQNHTSQGECSGTHHLCPSPRHGAAASRHPQLPVPTPRTSSIAPW